MRIDKDVSAIMGVNLWGGSCNPRALSELADSHGISLYFDSAHAFGCKVDDIHVGNFGQMEVFSFHATKILSPPKEDASARMMITWRLACEIFGVVTGPLIQSKSPKLQTVECPKRKRR
jgi:hypothetical protein